MTGLFAHRSCILLKLQLSNDGHQFVLYEGPPQIFCEQCLFEDELKSWQRDLAHGCAGASIAWAAANDVGETLSSCWGEASQVILTSLRVAVRQPMEQDVFEWSNFCTALRQGMHELHPQKWIRRYSNPSPRYSNPSFPGTLTPLSQVL